jgi:hypothetical protein
VLPSGDDDRFVGFGVMGLPFSSGHYLALRQFPATSFASAYASVWHRDPDGTWTFYATTPGEQSCSRYLGSATPNDPVQCDIDISWVTPWSLLVQMPGLLEWTVDMRASVATRLLSTVSGWLPARAWTNRSILEVISRIAGPTLGVGDIRLAGITPNGQYFMVAPRTIWAVTDSRAVLRGEDLGRMEALGEQAVLGDFHLPQRGICVVVDGHLGMPSFD